MGKMTFQVKIAFLLLHIKSRGITLPVGIVKFGGCNMPTFQQACKKDNVHIVFLWALSEDYSTISYFINQFIIEHEINKT